MKKYEKLILLIIGLLLLSKVGFYIRDIIFTYYFGADELTYLDRKNFEAIGFFIKSFVNIGCAIWLFIESGRNNLNKWIWSIFGLFFGLVGIAIYYLISIYIELKIRKET